MRIATKSATPDEYTEHVHELVKGPATHIYFDTSFLMWLTRIQPIARAEFLLWTQSFEGRMHVPLWAMHEYYRHHTSGTLKSSLSRRAHELVAAAKAFRNEAFKYSIHSSTFGPSGAAFGKAVETAVDAIKEICDAVDKWDYEGAAQDVISWMNERVCETDSVFRTIKLISSEGGGSIYARHSSRLP